MRAKNTFFIEHVWTTASTLCIKTCTTVRKFFGISLVVEWLIYSKKSIFSFSRIKTISEFNMYSTISQSTIITSPIGFNIALTNVEARLKQRCINVVPTLCNVVWTLCNVVSTSGIGVVSTLRNVENPTSDFVSFSKLGRRYFDVDPQRWNNVDPTLKCWLGTGWQSFEFFIFYSYNNDFSLDL